jgi:hypothetical protein
VPVEFIDENQLFARDMRRHAPKRGTMLVRNFAGAHCFGQRPPPFAETLMC